MRRLSFQSQMTEVQLDALEQLARSPQCGFATSVLGNALALEDQAAKLRTIAETTAQVWG